VAEPAEAEDRDEVARPGTAVAQRVERCRPSLVIASLWQMPQA
jgi:hypothetical protein